MRSKKVTSRSLLGTNLSLYKLDLKLPRSPDRQSMESCNSKKHTAIKYNNSGINGADKSDNLVCELLNTKSETQLSQYFVFTGFSTEKRGLI